MSIVQTIRGPVDSSTLGRILSHEHLTNGMGGMERVPGLLDRDAMIDRSVRSLARAKAAGIDGIIDLTPLDLGRQVWLFEAVAERTESHVIPATGVYRWIPPYFFNWDIDEIAAYFVSEIEDGIEGSRIRAGIIKLAWDMEYQLHDPAARVTPRIMLERTARAAARASKATGTPISCHTRAIDQLGTPLLDILSDEGLDLRAVTIGHSNDTDNLDYLTGMLKRGATVGLDRFFGTDEAYVAQRGGIALALVRAGFADQITLGHDGSPAGLWGRWRTDDTDGCWTLVPNLEVPWMQANGATDDEIDAVLRGSIRATFEAAAAMAGR